MRDPPKSHVDADLGVGNLAQVSHVLQENQQRIEETEAQLQALMRQHARLVAAGRLLEQQKVLDVLATGPELGYDSGRPIASLLVYRCCLRWGCFTSDSQAASVLDNLSALLLTATDEDAIAARTTAAAQQAKQQQQAQQEEGASGAGADAGGGTPGGGFDADPHHPEGDVGALVEQAAVAAATREVAYWLAVTSVLLALVDPHLPLTAAAMTRGSVDAAAASSHAHAHHIPAPLAAVAVDARASMAAAAQAARAKVQELQKKMGSTFSGMQALGKNLLLRGRRGATGAGAGRGRAGSGGAEAAAGIEGGGGGGAQEREQPQRQNSGAVPDVEAVGGEAQEQGPHHPVTVPAAPPSTSAGGGGASRSRSPSLGGPDHQPSSPPAAAAAAAATSYSPQAFRQQLDLIVQKTYVQMRDSLKRQVSAVLPGCVQQPPAAPPASPTATATASPGGESPAEQLGVVEGEGRMSGGGAGPAVAHGGEPASGAEGGVTEGGALDASAASPSPPSSSLQSWHDLIAVLSYHLALLREAHVPRILIRCLFKQTLTFVDVQLFNQLLLRPECCSTSNARYLVAGLQLLQGWITDGQGHGQGQQGGNAGGNGGAGAQPGGGSVAGGVEAVAVGEGQGRGAGGGAGPGPGMVVVGAGEELAVLVDDLRHIRQASHFLMLANKGALRLDDFTAMCPALNVQQLYRLATTFWDDSPMPPPPPPQSPPQSPPRTSKRTLSGDAASAAATAAEAEAETAEAVGEGGAEGGGEGKPAAGEEKAQAAPEEEEEEEEEEDAAAAMEAAAAAAVAAAAAAAAADEAGDAAPEAPPPPPEAAAAAAAAASASSAAAAAVSRNVSGEVLEEMKRRHAVANNGGLIVTFLLDEEGGPLIVQGGGGAVARQLLAVVNEPRLHEGLHGGLPPALRGEDCPPAAFAFMLDAANGGGGSGGSGSGSVPAAAATGAGAAGH
ncbi:hypothetical protein PLESTM_002026000 [Pleodorina starrii]|nr:hypothetical protein PLESTM_002026000 [Pleodorina starrii]